MTQGMQGDALGLSRVRADDELLDHLAAREVVESGDPLVALLGSWTREIDADEAATAPVGGLFGGGWHDEPAAPTTAAATPVTDFASVRTLRVNGSRAAAVAAALVVAMSGGGVAAAMTGRDVPIVSHIVEAARPLVVAGSAPTPTAAPTTAGGAGTAAWAGAVARMMESELAAGDRVGARQVLDAIPPAAYADPASAAKIAQWKSALAALDNPVPGVTLAGPTAGPTTGPTTGTTPPNDVAATTPDAGGSSGGSTPPSFGRPDRDSGPTSKPAGPTGAGKSTGPVSGSGSQPPSNRPDPTPTGPVRGGTGGSDPAVPTSVLTRTGTSSSAAPEPSPDRPSGTGEAPRRSGSTSEPIRTNTEAPTEAP